MNVVPIFLSGLKYLMLTVTCIPPWNTSVEPAKALSCMCVGMGQAAELRRPSLTPSCTSHERLTRSGSKATSAVPLFDHMQKKSAGQLGSSPGMHLRAFAMSNRGNLSRVALAMLCTGARCSCMCGRAVGEAYGVFMDLTFVQDDATFPSVTVT